jgi:phosphoglucomutase
VPNPENPAALSMAIDLAKKVDADLVIGTDPDSDRIGIAVRTTVDGNETYVPFSGNQVGLMLLDYILDSKKSAGTLPEGSFAVTTIVSSKLAGAICKYYGVELQEVLTGFKFIGERIKLDDEFGSKHFQFGFEESYGYLSGLDVRDKDAVVAAMLIAGMYAQSRERGQSLTDRLESIYERFGYGFEETVSITLEGKEGIEKIAGAMVSLREDLENCKNIEDAKRLLSGAPVVAVRDYQKSKRYVFTESGIEVEPIDLPVSNVLLYELGGDKGLDWACARPSGTEPKLKIYFGIYGNTRQGSSDKLAETKEKVTSSVKAKL